MQRPVCVPQRTSLCPTAPGRPGTGSAAELNWHFALPQGVSHACALKLTGLHGCDCHRATLTTQSADWPSGHAMSQPGPVEPSCGGVEATGEGLSVDGC